MSVETLSERLFEMFCDVGCISYSKVPCGELQTPDYELVRGETKVIAEVKELCRNPEEKAMFKELQESKSVAGWADTRGRIANKSKDAYSQLKARSQGILPTILVLFDNETFGGIDGTDIKNAMYGSESWTITRNETHEIITPHLAQDGHLKVDRHRQLSAVACLKGWDESQRLYVFHNVYATNPLPVAFFQLEGCFQYTINLNTESLPEWEPIGDLPFT